MGAFGGSRQGAHVEAAPDAIANTRDEAVAEVADGARDPSEKDGDCGPGAGQRGEDGDGGIGAEQDLFRCSAGVADDEQGVGAGRRIGEREAVTG